MFIIDSSGELYRRKRRPSSALELASLGDCLCIPENRAWDADEADAVWEAVGLYHLVGGRGPQFSQAWLARRAAEYCRRGSIKLTADPDPFRISLMLDQDVVESFRASGPDWRKRINAALRAWLALEVVNE
jgi:hypothetical protein